MSPHILTLISWWASPAVSSILRHWLYDPATDTTIKLLMRSYRLGRPVGRVRMSKWVLQVVLSGLCKPPFPDSTGSDDVIDLKWRTVKTVFLISLATARRVSLIHALSADAHHIVWTRGSVQGQTVVRLLPQPGFLAKNQFPTQAPSWISIPGIARLNPHEPECLLCPVRQLRLSLRDTMELRRNRKRLSYIGTVV